MKKRLISCLCVLAMVTLTACSSSGNNSGDSEAQTGTLAQTGQVQSDEQTTAQTESTTEASESMSQSDHRLSLQMVLQSRWVPLKALHLWGLYL